jgi:hypothetical protein
MLLSALIHTTRAVSKVQGQARDAALQNKAALQQKKTK